jgi:branched-chain amino acid transport system ATP-binding protein
MLKVDNVEATYHRVILALRGVSLDVPTGAIVALLGPNGAGKTTTLKAVSGLLSAEVGRVTTGSIVFDGAPIHRLEAEAIARLGIIQVMEGRSVLEHLTVEENLEVAGYVRRDPRSLAQRFERVYTYFPRLAALKRRISGYISGGEQRMLVIGRALMAEPKLMLLDEPSLGLSPVLTEEIFRIVKRINAEQGTSILLVEQNAAMALDLASYAYVMENGRVVLDGPAAQLRDNADVREFYLGFGALAGRKSYRDVKHYKRRKRWLG